MRQMHIMYKDGYAKYESWRKVHGDSENRLLGRCFACGRVLNEDSFGAYDFCVPLCQKCAKDIIRQTEAVTKTKFCQWRKAARSLLRYGFYVVAQLDYSRDIYALIDGQITHVGNDRSHVSRAKLLTKLIKKYYNVSGFRKNIGGVK